MGVGDWRDPFRFLIRDREIQLGAALGAVPTTTGIEPSCHADEGASKRLYRCCRQAAKGQLTPAGRDWQ